MSDFTKCPVFSLYASSRKLIKVYTKYLDELGLTYPQYLVITYLLKNNGCSVDDIGKNLFLDSGTLTPLLKRLEVQGLITRKHSKEDERKKVIQLTKKGLEFENIFKNLKNKIRTHFQVTEAEAKQLIHLLDKILIADTL